MASTEGSDPTNLTKSPDSMDAFPDWQPQRDAEPDPSCTIVGTSGDNVLRGTTGDDVICGLGGDDTLRGSGGDDTILRGLGSDALYGGMAGTS